MQSPPRLERNPRLSYHLGHALAHGCFTHSVLVNGVRLAALFWMVPQAVLLLGGHASPLSFSVVLGILVFSFIMRPRLPRVHQKVERWTRDELRLAGLVEHATATDAPIMDMVHARLKQHPGIDYGTTPEGRPVCVEQELRRAHQLVTGGTGSGKSKFLATQAGQAVVHDTALVVVDPHEDIAVDVLRSAAHILARRGMILLWPGGPQRRIYPWNPLLTGPTRAPWQAADSVVGAVKRVWRLTDEHTYIIDVIRHTAWALAGAGWTLLEGRRFLTDDVFRSYIAERANIPEVSSWVSAYDALRARERTELIQTTLVRLARFPGNPYLQHMVGAGVCDPGYVTAYRRQGKEPVAGAELGDAINRGHHVFAVLPRRCLGEDQFLVAGLVQATLLEAVFRRRVNDPAVPMTEAYLDEAAVYATADGLGVMLPQTRKYHLTLVVTMQGLHQAEPALRDELQTNTRIKVVFATDHPDEVMLAAGSLYRYDPLLIKVDARQKIGDDEDRREVGQFQTYPPQEQQAFYASQIAHLPPRHYLLKIRGYGDPVSVITPDYAARYALAEALRIAGRKRVTHLVDPRELSDELAWRWHWLEERGYRPRKIVTPLPSFVASSGEAARQDVPIAGIASNDAETRQECACQDEHDSDSIPEQAAGDQRPDEPAIPTTFGGADDP